MARPQDMKSLKKLKETATPQTVLFEPKKDLPTNINAVSEQKVVLDKKAKKILKKRKLRELSQETPILKQRDVDREDQLEEEEESKHSLKEEGDS